jgi:hypothetical protein
MSREKWEFSIQRLKGTKVQRPICRELFEPLNLCVEVSVGLNIHLKDAVIPRW